MSAERINISRLTAKYGSATVATQDTVNAAGGLLILETPADFQFVRNANIFRAVKAKFKTPTTPNTHGYREIGIGDNVIFLEEDYDGVQSLEISDADNRDVASLAAAFIRGVAEIDVSAVLRTLTAKHFSTASSMHEDTACAIEYHADGFEDDESVITTNELFRALNGVAQVGEQQGLPVSSSAWLEDLPTAYIHVGLPWSFALKAGSASEHGVPALSVRVIEVNTASLTSIQNAMQSYGLDYARAVDCSVENPLYVRWLNRKGGVSYWLFERYQAEKYKAGNTLLREVYVTNTAAAVSNVEEYGKKASHTVTCGAGNLTTAQAAALRRLALSPIVEYWNGTRWTGITLESFEETAVRGNNRTALEFTFNLPSINL